MTVHWWRGLVPLGLASTLSGCDGTRDVPSSGGSGAGNGGGSSASGGASVGGAGGVATGGSSGDNGGFAGAPGGAATGGNSGDNGGSVGGAGGAASGGSSNAGRGGSTGTAGGAGTGGIAGKGSSTGGSDASGMAGEAPTGGTGGSGTPDVCSFELTGTVSADRATVGVVDWSTDLAGLTAARIEFSLDDPADGELNVGSGGPISVSEPRALMLGLKAERSYTYRIVVTAGDKVCVSPDRALLTRADPDAPAITRSPGVTAALRANGFIVTCGYRQSVAFIIDSDGDVVWWADAPRACSRAQMDWTGEYLWMLAANPTDGDTGEVTRVRMDGSGAESIPGLERSHHDFAALPGGATAFLMWDGDGSDQASYLVERSPAGTLTNVVRLDDAPPSSAKFHTNALRYYAADDSYTVSDFRTGITKLARDGQPEWRLAYGCSGDDAACAAATTVQGNHGHHLTNDGNLLFFSAMNGSTRGTNDPAPVYEYSFSEAAGALTAKLEWSFETQHTSTILGDVERLPNGNTLVTYSVEGATGTILEVSPTDELVQGMSGGAFGYTSFRETLYGPPQ